MLVDQHVVPTSAQFIADAAVVELVGHSRVAEGSPSHALMDMTSSLPCRSGN
jgi:hypothetical protein